MSKQVDSVIRVGYRAAYWGLRGWWWWRRPATCGAGVAIWHQDKVLLIRTSYRKCYSLPGGFVRRGETSEHAARRELIEELGIDLSDHELRHAWNGTLPFESRQDTVDIWEVILEDAPEMRPTGREIVWAGWMHPSQALQRRLLPHVALYLGER